MVAYETNYEEKENQESREGLRRDSRAYVNLFVRDALEPRNLYLNQQNTKDYFKNRKNKEQRKYGTKKEKVDPLELLAEIGAISSYGFGRSGYGGLMNSLYSRNVGDYSRGTTQGYSLGRGIADGDYSSENANYTAADAGNVSYSAN